MRGPRRSHMHGHDANARQTGTNAEKAVSSTAEHVSRLTKMLLAPFLFGQSSVRRGEARIVARGRVSSCTRAAAKEKRGGRREHAVATRMQRLEKGGACTATLPPVRTFPSAWREGFFGTAEEDVSFSDRARFRNGGW